MPKMCSAKLIPDSNRLLLLKHSLIHKTTNYTLSFCIKDVSAARNFVSAACIFYENNKKHSYFTLSGTKSTVRATTIAMDFQIGVVVMPGLSC